MQDTAGGNRIRRAAVPVAAFVAAMAAAVAGAFLTGSGEFGAVTQGVEDASSRANNLLGGVIDRFNVWYAFGVGMAAAVNPCGFAMLPAYLGLYLGDDEKKPSRASAEHERYVGVYWGRTRSAGLDLAARLGRALLIGGAVTAGFIVLFAAVGIPISLGAQGLADAFAWIGLVVGALLMAAGAYLLAGGKLYTSAAASLSSRIGDPNKQGAVSYFTFGVAYAVASLSCTLPLFLVVIGASLTANSFWDSARGFTLYGLGMGSVILALTLGMAAFKSAAAGVFRKALPYMGAVSAVLLLATGTFIVYYQLTLNELLGRIWG